jgi:hypothetical protein
MTRAQLEHVIRAAADIADDDEIIVIGSQAVLAQFPAAPPSCSCPSRPTSTRRTSPSAGT